jgi:YD repeat-containing protein
VWFAWFVGQIHFPETSFRGTGRRRCPTPTVTFKDYDVRVWQPKTILDAHGTNTFTYDLAGRLTSHTLNGAQ